MAALMTVSEIIKNKDLDDKEPKKKSREDWRKAKELEEARKAGTAPAAVDEEGKDINPHIPQYISTAPWYFGAKGPTLKHQRPQPEKQKSFAKLSEWYHRGIPSAPIVTKYRKGACTNCGAMTHKKKDCLERPRRVGAKYSGQNIAPDEFMQMELPLDYDGKRDRWNGYDPSEHSAIIEEFRKVEDAKRQLKSDTLKEDAEKDVDEDIDEDKYVDEVDMPGTKVDSKQRITVRNLRIREDTAKYLRNLDPNSAYYDPKTRAMRENPYLNTGKNPEEVDFAGENFVKYTGDTKNHAKAQLFAWEAYEKGVDIHLLAEPTKLELLQKEYGKVKENLKDSFKNNILEKYGGEQHLDVPPKELLLAQTECYIEYSRKGKIIKGDAKPVIRSKYKEDELNNNHTQIWGSYWNEGQWGYKCCHSFVKNSYCVGMKGSLKAPELLGAINLVENNEVEDNRDEEEDSPKTLMQLHTEKLSQKKKKKSQVDPEETVEEDRKLKLREALIKHEMEVAKAEKLLSLGDKKRPYNSMYDTKGPTEEEMEAYYLKKSRAEDPMANFLDT